MKLNIIDIGESPIRIQRSLTAQDVSSLLGALDIEIEGESGGAELDLEVSRTGGTLTVEGALSAEFAVSCARCLAPAAVSVDEPRLRLTFVPAATLVVSEDDGLDGSELDTFGHDGESLDMRGLLGEYLVAAIPIAPLCRWDCKGICVECGVNLNETQCSCPSRQAPSNKWATALQEIKKRGLS